MSAPGRSPVGAVQPVQGINVTPIIDVALVLVILLLITAPMLSVVDASLALPDSSAQATDGDDRIFVTLTRDGQLGVDDQVVAPQSLETLIAERINDGKHPNALVVIRADRSATHAEVKALLAAARAAGAPRIAVATRPGELR